MPPSIHRRPNANSVNALGNTDVLSWITNNSPQLHQYHFTFSNQAGHSINDVRLIPIELIRSKRDSVRNAREAHLESWCFPRDHTLSVYYTMPNKYGKCNRDFGAFLFLLVSTFLYFGGVFNKTIILLALVGYEMIIANSAPRWLSIISYPTRARRIIVKYIHILSSCTWWWHKLLSKHIFQAKNLCLFLPFKIPNDILNY